MIIKKSLMRAAASSSYRRLANYLMNEQTKEHIRNIAMWHSSDNYEEEDIDLFLKEVKAVQRKNTKSKDDRTYHLIVSFREDEMDINKLKDIEKDIVKAMGFEEHQRLCVVHNDTDNIHFHIAINKINPNTNKIYTPYRDYQKLNDISAALEKKYNLIQDNHIKSEKPYSKAQDIEKAGYMNTFTNYINNLDLSNINSWYEFHEELNQQGVMYLKKGAGSVFASEDKKIYVKPSSINRDFSISKLEERFGDYKSDKYLKEKEINRYEKKPLNDKDNIYNDYCNYKDSRKKLIQNELNKLEEEYQKNLNTEIYNIKKLLNMTVLKDASYIEQMVINMAIKNLVKDKKQQAYKNKLKEKDKIYLINPYLRFEDWLKKEAINNNIKVREYIDKEIKKENYILADLSSEMEKAVKVTKNGTYIMENNIRINQKGINIRSLHEYSILKNIEYYTTLYPGHLIEVAGCDEFKNKIAEVVVKNDLQIKFTDEDINNKVLEIRNKEVIDNNNLLTEFNKIHNDKMYKYKQLSNIDMDYEFRGFVKHQDKYLMIVRSYQDNTFYVKSADKYDYKNIKGVHKGSSVSFESQYISNKNLLILQDFIKEKEETKLKYEELKGIDIKDLNFEGVRKFKDKIIYLYKNKEGNRIYTKVATKADLEQYKNQNKKEISEKKTNRNNPVFEK